MIHRLAFLALVSAAFTAEISANDKIGVPTTGPLASPWDANAWESGSDRVFWRAGAERSKSPAQGKPTTPTTPRTAASPSPAASAAQAPAKPDFSNRQSEK